MERRVHVGRIGGVELTLDWSWIFTFVLAARTLVSLDRRCCRRPTPCSLAFAPPQRPRDSSPRLGRTSSFGFDRSRASGAPVRRLTLFVLGGVTGCGTVTCHPRTEALAAIVAPAASFGIGLVLALGVAIASAPLPTARWPGGDLDRLGAPARGPRRGSRRRSLTSAVVICSRLSARRGPHSSCGDLEGDRRHRPRTRSLRGRGSGGP